MLHSGNGFSDFIQEVNSKWFLLIVIIVVGVFPFQKQQNQSDTPPPLALFNHTTLAMNT